MLEDRNPEWVAAHPEVAARLTRNRWYVWCSWALGAVSIAVLVAAQTDAWPRALSAPAFEAEHWMVLSDVHTALSASSSDVNALVIVASSNTVSPSTGRSSSFAWRSSSTSSSPVTSSRRTSAVRRE
jgi:hypothetical protein